MADRSVLPKTEPIEAAVQTDTSEFFVVGIGASAGGLAALEQFFQNMPPKTGLAFVVVQHLSPNFKSYMDELLARRTKMAIYQVEEGMQLEPNSIYLIPPRKNVTLTDDQFHLTDHQDSERLNLPIDVFLQSLAKAKAKNAIAVILSGTGSDGSRGLRDVSEAGGLVVVQDQASAGFDGMPFSARSTGLTNLVLPPEQMPAAILNYVKSPEAPLTTVGSAIKDPAQNNELWLITSILRQHYNLDFTQYRTATIKRRIERRIGLTHSETMQTYAQRLQNDPREVETLYHDLLVEVTEFFRDLPAFEELRSRVVAPLVANTDTGKTIRAWVPGCATGEEAYTLAILFHNECKRQNKQVNIKIFATDVHEQVLIKAGVGEYTEKQVANVPVDYLPLYFVRTNKQFTIRKDIRQMIVFAHHNLLVDPPFTRLDLIICRNVLIYLQPDSQKRILSNFHFGLKKDGVLFLGPSEHIGDLSDEFDPVVQRWRIYRKRRNVRLSGVTSPAQPTGITYPVIKPPLPANRMDADDNDWALDFLSHYLPPSLLVDDNYQLQRTFGKGEEYIRIPGGNISLSVLTLLEGELHTAVRAGLHRAANEGTKVTYSNISVDQSNEPQRLNVTITPVFSQTKAKQLYVITFESIKALEANQREAIPLDVSEEALEHISRLESELDQAREQLQTMIEELETTNEELQSANEELMSSNEELQSSNEELQSVNEEMYTVNAEYHEKIEELTQITNDLHNLQRSSQVGTIFLDRALRIREFTPAITDTFNLLRQDVGRPLAHLIYNIQISETEMEQYVTSVLTEGDVIEREITAPNGNSYLMRILPYQTDAGLTEGVVLT
ncbi:MAG: chemotaxis protein CheB, partial [Anaerolineae bacterium]|nr:chemotaxis protein CheB [Anaerolineae bacterium]